jgi:hypothetical protein
MLSKEYLKKKLMVNKKKKNKKDTNTNRYNDGKTRQNQNIFLREKESGRFSLLDDLYSMSPLLSQCMFHNCPLFVKPRYHHSTF